MPDLVDVILLRRDATDPPEAVRLALASQRGVDLLVRRVVGTPGPGDPNRWATIARARNAGKRLGSAPWVLYLDDDVVLGPDCIVRLVDGLKRRPDFAALGADYSGALARSLDRPDERLHVTMGATLFRRDRLEPLTFRWSPGRCECRCACDDLHRDGLAIGYLPEARATHLKGKDALTPAKTSAPDPSRPVESHAGRVLAAFDRNHLGRFRRQFLGSLRGSGNPERVTAVAYGLYPSERNALGMTPGVEVLAVADDGVSPSKRRLVDFQAAIAGWPDDTPVAHWDAGDILFQGRLAPLWDLVRRHPDKLLAVAEPTRHPENPAIRHWTETIADPSARRRAMSLCGSNPWLNGGFAAGTAGTFRRYLREAGTYFKTPALAGSRDWGDQTALNLYCHTHPDAWRSIDPGWNYCLHNRTRLDYAIAPDGRVSRLDGRLVPVAHGNAGKLRHTELAFWG